ncbi:serine-rich adhesin for platelets-like [Mya arenaria]|uniref:serine-rich adhesin for platelets-like n=1 Tax=Mya arenaria TaxID=6604 RepID=UPI0022E90CF5|nr:serine-rich adhesin for platelets-like [Mya arenaria]
MLGQYLLDQLNILQERGIFCDLDLMARDRTKVSSVHYLVFIAFNKQHFKLALLSATSDLFSKKVMMFSCLDVAEVQALVDFLYGRKFETEARYNLICSVLKKLSLLELIDKANFKNPCDPVSHIAVKIEPNDDSNNLTDVQQTEDPHLSQDDNIPPVISKDEITVEEDKPNLDLFQENCHLEGCDEVDLTSNIDLQRKTINSGLEQNDVTDKDIGNLATEEVVHAAIEMSQSCNTDFGDNLCAHVNTLKEVTDNETSNTNTTDEVANSKCENTGTAGIIKTELQIKEELSELEMLDNETSNADTTDKAVDINSENNFSAVLLNTEVHIKDELSDVESENVCKETDLNRDGKTPNSINEISDTGGNLPLIERVKQEGLDKEKQVFAESYANETNHDDSTIDFNQPMDNMPQGNASDDQHLTITQDMDGFLVQKNEQCSSLPEVFLEHVKNENSEITENETQDMNCETVSCEKNDETNENNYEEHHAKLNETGVKKKDNGCGELEVDLLTSLKDLQESVEVILQGAAVGTEQNTKQSGKNSSDEKLGETSDQNQIFQNLSELKEELSVEDNETENISDVKDIAKTDMNECGKQPEQHLAKTLLSPCITKTKKNAQSPLGSSSLAHGDDETAEVPGPVVEIIGLECEDRETDDLKENVNDSTSELEKRRQHLEQVEDMNDNTTKVLDECTQHLEQVEYVNDNTTQVLDECRQHLGQTEDVNDITTPVLEKCRNLLEQNVSEAALKPSTRRTKKNALTDYPRKRSSPRILKPGLKNYKTESSSLSDKEVEVQNVQDRFKVVITDAYSKKTRSKTPNLASRLPVGSKRSPVSYFNRLSCYPTDTKEDECVKNATFCTNTVINEDIPRSESLIKIKSMPKTPQLNVTFLEDIPCTETQEEKRVQRTTELSKSERVGEAMSRISVFALEKTEAVLVGGLESITNEPIHSRCFSQDKKSKPGPVRILRNKAEKILHERHNSVRDSCTAAYGTSVAQKVASGMSSANKNEDNPSDDEDDDVPLSDMIPLSGMIKRLRKSYSEPNMKYSKEKDVNCLNPNSEVRKCVDVEKHKSKHLGDISIQESSEEHHFNRFEGGANNEPSDIVMEELRTLSHIVEERRKGRLKRKSSNMVEEGRKVGLKQKSSHRVEASKSKIVLAQTKDKTVRQSRILTTGKPKASLTSTQTLKPAWLTGIQTSLSALLTSTPTSLPASLTSTSTSLSASLTGKPFLLPALMTSTPTPLVSSLSKTWTLKPAWLTNKPTSLPAFSTRTPTLLPPSLTSTPTSLQALLPGTATSLPARMTCTTTSLPALMTSTLTSLPASLTGTPTSLQALLPCTPSSLPSSLAGTPTSLTGTPTSLPSSLTETPTSFPPLLTGARQSLSQALLLSTPTSLPASLASTLTTLPTSLTGTPTTSSASLTSTPASLPASLTSTPTILLASLTSTPTSLSASLTTLPTSIPTSLTSTPTPLPTSLTCTPTSISASLTSTPTLLPASLTGTLTSLSASLTNTPASLPTSLTSTPTSLLAALTSTPTSLTSTRVSPHVIPLSLSLRGYSTPDHARFNESQGCVKELTSPHVIPLSLSLRGFSTPDHASYDESQGHVKEISRKRARHMTLMGFLKKSREIDSRKERLKTDTSTALKYPAILDMLKIGENQESQTAQLTRVDTALGVPSKPSSPVKVSQLRFTPVHSRTRSLTRTITASSQAVELTSALSSTTTASNQTQLKLAKSISVSSKTLAINQTGISKLVLTPLPGRNVITTTSSNQAGVSKLVLSPLQATTRSKAVVSKLVLTPAQRNSKIASSTAPSSSQEEVSELVLTPSQVTQMLGTSASSEGIISPAVPSTVEFGKGSSASNSQSAGIISPVVLSTVQCASESTTSNSSSASVTPTSFSTDVEITKKPPVLVICHQPMMKDGKLKLPHPADKKETKKSKKRKLTESTASEVANNKSELLNDGHGLGFRKILPKPKFCLVDFNAKN